MKYPATYTPAPEGGFIVSFRDIPEAITQGENDEEAYEMAKDALETAMDFYFEEKRRVPVPSAPQKGERLVPLQSSVAAKVKMLNEKLAH
jgi:antitoxin HicB